LLLNDDNSGRQLIAATMNNKKWQKLAGYAFGLIIFVGILIIIPNKKIEGHSQQILQNFIEWFGILFSVLLALMIVQVSAKYNLVESLVDKEADAWVSLVRFARFLGKPNIFKKLREAIVEHCKNFSRGRHSAQVEMSYVEMSYNESLEKIFFIIHKALKKTDESFAAKEMIRCFDEAIDTRGDRDALLKERIPEVLWFMMTFTSMIWLLCFFFTW
jgi:hypothetical protein